MRHIKMIVSDLDRTLLKKDKCISEYSKSVINKCCQNGIMIVFATARPERATKLNITNHYPDVYVLPNSGENWHQIMHYTLSKFNAIFYLSKLIGIAVEDIISFGDDYNDVEMLQKCGVGVAVENAVDDAKTAANFICDTNDNDGVAKFIEKYILCSE